MPEAAPCRRTEKTANTGAPATWYDNCAVGIDEAYALLRAIRDEVPPDDVLPINESCTRLKLIDPILIDVLGWPRSCIDTEITGGQAGTGGTARLDYLLHDDDRNWFVVEAKKRTPPVVDPKGNPGTFLLGGPVLKDVVLPIVEEQMAPYIGRHLPAFGIVTTGEQWIGFLAVERPTNIKIGDTRALVFRSLDDILGGRFELFYRCFAAEEISRRFLEAELRTGRGAISCASPVRGVALDLDRPLSYQQDEHFYGELRRAMTAAFTNVGDDPAALEACFVESRQSRDADTRLRQIENELAEVLDDASKYPPLVGQQIDQQPGKTGSQLPGADALRGKGCLARILGARSAGKSWFLRRFYETQLPSEQQKHAAIIFIDAEALEPFDADRASQLALDSLREDLFGPGGPDWQQLSNVYAREWRAWLRPQGVVPEEASQELRREFARSVDADERRNPAAALYKYADFSVRNRRKLPCFVIDNADGVDRARLAADWAVALYKNTFSLTTIAVDDASLWRLRSRGDEDYLARQSPEQFWLPRPMVKEVIENRCRYLSTVLRESSPNGNSLSTTIGFKKQYTWTVDVEKLASVVSAVLLEDQEISTWIGEICNYDIREVLELCKEIVLSPRVKATELLKGQTTGRFDRRRVMRAIISPRNEQYQNHADDRVMNIFGYWLEDEWAPLLPFRLLAFLDERERAEQARGEPFPGFVPVRKVVDLFVHELGTPAKMVLSLIERLRNQALVEMDNPARSEIDTPHARVHVTSRGRVHLEWAREPTYVRMMAEVEPISEMSVARTMREAWQAFLDASGRNDGSRGSRMQTAERSLIRAFVDHVINTAELVSPLRGELVAVQNAQDELIRHWVETN